MPDLNTVDPRKKALFDQIASAILPAEKPPVNPTLEPPVRTPGPEILAPAPANVPLEENHEPVRIGLGTKGLIGVDKALADLDARRQADSQYGTGITSTPDFVEENAPKPAHKSGIGDRLKHFARDAVIQGGEYQRSHPGASLAELASAALTGGGISAASPNTGDAMFRQAQIGDAERDVSRQLGIEKERAQIDSLRTAPWYKQAQIALGETRNDIARGNQSQRGDLTHKRLLISQLNSLKEFDPEDPKNAAFVSELKANGIQPVKKVSGSLLQYVEGTDANGNAVFNVIDKGRGTAQEVTGGNLPEKTERQLGREVQQTEGAANRANHITVAKIAAAAADSRQARQLAVEIGKLGDPDEIADTAAEIRKQAQSKRDAANGTKDYAQKQSLNREAERLDKAATDLDTQGLKARGARGGAGSKGPTATPSVEVKPKTMGMSRERFKKDNPAYRNRSNKEIDQIISDEGYAPLP